MKIYGVDFTSAPCARKQITVALGEPEGEQLAIVELERLPDFASFERMLERPGPWVAGFDFPFGLARQAVADLSWPLAWSDLVAHCRSLGRPEFKRLLDAYRQARPAGNRYARRRGDAASGAHPSVKLVNPPVGYMFLEGASRLAAAGLHVPGLRAADATRVALEAYPGLLVRSLGVRDSYKSDAPGEWTGARKAVRGRILRELQAGRPLGIQVRLGTGLEARIVEDGSGDFLDAVICAAQAHWGFLRQDANYGLPADVDPIEGWIVSAQFTAA
jgi:hypothetical protein